MARAATAPPPLPQLDGQLPPSPLGRGPAGQPSATLDGILPPPPLLSTAPAPPIVLTWSTLLPPMPTRPPPTSTTLLSLNSAARSMVHRASGTPATDQAHEPVRNVCPRAKAFSGRQRAQAWVPELPRIPEHSQYTELQPPPLPLPSVPGRLHRRRRHRLEAVQQAITASAAQRDGDRETDTRTVKTDIRM